MKMPEIVSQHKFETLEDFVKHEGNFHIFFVDNPSMARDVWRNKPVFLRFREQNQSMETELTKVTTEARNTPPYNKLPYEKLYEAYQIMGNLVYVGDANDIDEYYLLH